jgi:hypothetical protein
METVVEKVLDLCFISYILIANVHKFALNLLGN